MAALPAEARAEVDFLASELLPQGPGRVLDVPCGDGRLSIGLAAPGHTVTGVDISEEFVAAARASSIGRPAEWFTADMRHRPWPCGFDAAFCFGNSFGYLPPSGTMEFLHAVSAALRPGGRFALETGMAAESLLPELRDNFRLERGGYVLAIANHYIAEESRLDTQYTFIRDGVLERKRMEQCVYTCAEIRRMLEAAGMTTLALYSGVSREPYRLGAQRLIVVAERRP